MLNPEQNTGGLGNEEEIKTGKAVAGDIGYEKEDVERVEEQEIVLTEEEKDLIELKQKIEKGVREGELLKSIIEQEKVILTEDQEKAKRYVIRCLKDGDTFSAESRVRLLPEQEVQKIAKEIYLSAIEEGKFSVAESIKREFSIQKDFIKSGKVQEAAKNSYLSLIDKGYLYFAKEIQKELCIPEEFTQSEEVQEIIKEKEKLNPELTEEQKKSLEELRRELERGKLSVYADSRETLPIVEKINELPTETLNSYPDIKENFVKLIIEWTGNSKRFRQLVKCGLVEIEDYKVPLIQKIGAKLKEESIRESVNLRTIESWIKDSESKYYLEEEDLLKNADIQNLVMESF